MGDALRLPSPCLVVLVGPGASGKSTWAEAHFSPQLVVASDGLRALVGTGEDDIEASADAFELLDRIVALRVARRLTTVIDTLGLDPQRRHGWIELARQHDMPCIAVAFDTPAAECRARNGARDKRIPSAALTAQLKAWPGVREALAADGFDEVITPAPVRVVPPAFVTAAAAVQRQHQQPTGLRFGLQLAAFTWPGGPAATADQLRRIATHAELAGFDAIWVMDHFRQIPQIGRAWDDFLESYTTLAYLAACTERVRLGTLVSGITYRNVAHLGKIVATLDVLSGGRVTCGLGLAWFQQEHAAYGWDFPTVRERYALVEDALQLLPILWGPGSPPFHGKVLNVAEALCYPRPLQEHVPILLGGGGERRTLRLAAQYADACNVLGDAARVGSKTAVLHAHCEAVGRDPASVAVTNLTTALVAENDRQLGLLVEQLRPRRADPARYGASVNAGTVDDQVGRFREVAEAGASEVMLRLPDLGTVSTVEESLERMAKVIAAFR